MWLNSLLSILIALSNVLLIKRIILLKQLNNSKENEYGNKTLFFLPDSNRCAIARATLPHITKWFMHIWQAFVCLIHNKFCAYTSCVLKNCVYTKTLRFIQIALLTFNFQLLISENLLYWSRMYIHFQTYIDYYLHLAPYDQA